MPPFPNSSSSCSSAASDPGQNSNSSSFVQRRGNGSKHIFESSLKRLERIGQEREEFQRHFREAQEGWNAEHERRMAEAAREEAEAEAQALLDAQAKAQREQKRDDKVDGLLAWMADLQLETKSLRAKVERLEEELAEVRAAGAAGAGGAGDDDREE